MCLHIQHRAFKNDKSFKFQNNIIFKFQIDTIVKCQTDIVATSQPLYLLNLRVERIKNHYVYTIWRVFNSQSFFLKQLWHWNMLIMIRRAFNSQTITLAESKLSIYTIFRRCVAWQCIRNQFYIFHLACSWGAFNSQTIICKAFGALSTCKQLQWLSRKFRFTHFSDVFV